MSRGYDMIIINIRLNLAILFILENTFPYSLKCPELSHRNHRAHSYCPSNSVLNYACLLDRNENQMNESCSDIADFAPVGDKYIMSGRRTTTPCSFERYQPFKLYANISCQCLFRKSICSEEGQIVLEYGSTIADKTCQCDFNKGYDYIYRPRDPCSCIPSEEDCSCYVSQRNPGYTCDVGLPYPPEGNTTTPVSIEENAVLFQSEKRKTYPPLIACLVLSLVNSAAYFIIKCVRDTDRNKYRQISVISSCTNGEENVAPVQEIQDSCSENDRITNLQHTIIDHPETMDSYVHSSDRDDNHTKEDQTNRDTDNKIANTESVASTEIPKNIADVKAVTVNRSAIVKKPEDVKLVAAIDIGTTFSVYAYCLTENIKKGRLSCDSVELNKPWDARKGGLWSRKTPTCILLSENREAISIGYDAQIQYRNYMYGEESKDYDSDEIQNECSFVDNFKMKLYDENFFANGKPQLKDVKGKSVPAEDVLSGMISMLKKRVEEENNNIQSESIHWILTVPAIWTSNAKDFMERCAIKADINKSRLSIIVESEAASVYVYQLMRDGKIDLPMKKMPNKYLVIDLGGGTSDITAHGVEKGKLKKLCPPSGSDNGGKKVEHYLVAQFEEILGSRVHNKLQNDPSYLELLEEFESLNNNVSVTTLKRVACKIPLSILSAINQISGESFSNILAKESSGKSKGILLTNDRLRFEKNIITSFIKKISAGIVADINHVLDRTKSSEIKTFIVVGGFSNSPIIREELLNTYRNKTILFPPKDREVAVVKGATLYGMNRSIIQDFKE